MLISILFKCFRCSNESNQKAIRDRSSKVQIAQYKYSKVLKRSMIEQALVSDTTKSWLALEKRCEDLKLLRCLIRPSLRHEEHGSFLVRSRLDLLNRTDPGEAVKNVEYIL